MDQDSVQEERPPTGSNKWVLTCGVSIIYAGVKTVGVSVKTGIINTVIE